MSYHIPLISIILSDKLVGTHLTKILSFTKFGTYLEFLSCAKYACPYSNQILFMKLLMLSL